MSTLSSDAGSDRRAVWPWAAGAAGCVDHQSIAGLIDVVLGAEPVRLTTLFSILWDTKFKFEARTIIRSAVACRDPLSGLDVICKTALHAANGNGP